VTTTAEAIEMVEEAFAAVPRPSNAQLLHPQCRDDGDIASLYAYEDWREVPDSVIEREYAALSFLSAAGYRCFIPAYLRFGLRHADSGAAAVDSMIWSLLPEMYEGDLVSFTRSKYELLTPTERHAIELTLEALAPLEGLDAARALASWRGEAANTKIRRDSC
jgi:hypothetical protein